MKKESSRITLKDIAAKAGVDYSTVSRALRDDPRGRLLRPETRERIKAAARELGYRPNLMARSLKTGHSRMVGLFGFSLQHEVNAPLVVNLTRDLIQAGYSAPLIYDCYDEEFRFKECRALLDQGCEALVLSTDFSEEVSRKILNFPVPVFWLSQYPDNPLNKNLISYDYAMGCRAALNDLETKGHRHVLFLGGGWDAWKQDARFQVFNEFIGRHFSGADGEDFLFKVGNQDDLTLDHIRKLLQAHPLTTAMVTSNDIVAMRLIQILQLLNIRVPEDMSVIGFDDIRTAQYCTPALSTVHKAVELAGQEMLKMIRNTLENLELPVLTRIPCQYIPRKSAGAPRKQALIF